MRSVGADRLLSMLHQAVVPPARPAPLVLAWRWRYEMALLVGFLLVLTALVQALGPDWTMCVITAVTTLLIGWPPARHRLLARAWCIITPHRLRVAFAEARIHTRRGRLPAILWCAPKIYGEQILVWCPVGVIAEDFVAARQVLADACYATEVEVVPDPRYRHVVILGVIRYQTVPAVPKSPEPGR